MTVRLRPAGGADAAQLFDWVNRPDSLAGKRHTTAAIPWETHVAWLARQLQDRASALWIVERDGEAVGQVRLSGAASGRRLVDIYIVAAARRGGLAAAALRLALTQAATLWPGQPVHAEVRTDNQPSHRLFRHLGFSPAGGDETCMLYEFTPQGGDRS